MRAWPVLLALAAAMAQAPPQSVARVITTARALQPGEVVEFTMATAGPGYSVRLNVFERTWPAFQVDATTWRALVGIDLDTVPGAYAAVITVAPPGPGPALPARLTRRLVVVKKS